MSEHGMIIKMLNSYCTIFSILLKPHLC
ncbi:hypothetical protein LXL04_038851 [Taraxacum kok-saghyz]